MTDRLSINWSSLQIHRGRNLPHWRADAVLYHVVLRLADSIPAAKLEAWRLERQALLEQIVAHDRQPNASELQRLDFLFSERMDSWLDQGYGACWLRQPSIADGVAGALMHFQDQRYVLHAWCIMPSHVHVIVEPLPYWELAAILHSWTSYTANQANRELGRKGQFWQHEPYDHIIRSAREYRHQVEYVYNNPEHAGLTPWPWRWCQT